MSPPFIPDYKKSFITKQFLQTCFGGMKFFSPLPFIIIQVILFLVPLVILVPVSLGTAEAKVKAIVTGCSIFLVDFCLCMGINYLKRGRSQNNVTPVEEGVGSEGDAVGGTGSTGNIMTALSHPEEGFVGNRDTSFLSEEDEVTNEGLFKPSTWSFIAPNVTFGIKYFVGLLMSSWAFGLCTPLLTSQEIPAVLRGFDLFALSIARYSAVLNAPSEIATFNLAARKHLVYRPFYAAFLGLSNDMLIQNLSSKDEKYSSLLTHGIILAVLPVIWASGILPSLDALFPWIVETILGLISVGSLNVYYFGTVLSLIISGLCPVIVFVITHDPLLIILMECVCGYIISCDIGRIITMKSSLCEDTPTKSFLRILVQPVLIISTSLICVLLVWKTMSEVAAYEWQLGFAIVSLVVSTSSWIFQDTVSSVDPEISKVFLVPMSILYGLIQFVLHIWLTLAMRQDDNNWSSITRSAEEFNLRQLVPFLLTIRAFSVAICEPRLSSVDYTIAFLWKTSMGESKNMSFVVVLFIVSLITRRIIRFMKYLKMFFSIWNASLISNLIEAKVVISAIAIGFLPISILSILLASICEGFTVTPLFTLPILLLNFPRPMSFWKDKWFPSRTNMDKSLEIIRITPDLETVDWKIYSEIGPLIAKSIVKKAHKFKLKLTKGSCYLARYEDRLIFIRVLSCCWNFTYIQIKGLEMQEQTSCHHQEAAEVDEKLEDSLDTNYIKKYLARYTISNLSPRFSIKVPTYSESKSSVANLTNPQDKSIFQDMFYRAFSYLWIKSNPVLKGESYQRLMESNNKTTLAQSSSPSDVNANKRGGGIPPVDSKETNPLNKDFSVTNALFKCTLPSVNLINLRTNNSNLTSANNPSAIPSSTEVLTDANEVYRTLHLKAPRKASVHGEDPADLTVLSRQNTRSTLISPTGNRSLLSSSLMGSSFEDKDFTASDRLSLVWIKQCVGDVIPPNAIKARVEKLCSNIWLSVTGNDPDLEIKFWEFFHEDFIEKIKSLSSGSTPRKVNMEEITLKAYRYATKLTLDEMYSSKFISDTTVITLDEVKEEEIFAQLTLFEREYEFCTRDEIPLKLHERTNRIISIVKHPNSSDVHDSIMRILNYETEGVEFRVGQMDQFTVEGIWSNLNLELLYFTSDDDERFSIQSDRQLLRNIVTQCAKTPLGYPVYDATFQINLFDFSVTEVN